MVKVTPSCRVALKNDSYTLHKILPNKIDPLVSLMMVEKVSDSTYEMVGGLDKQIKEVIELSLKHNQSTEKCFTLWSTMYCKHVLSSIFMDEIDSTRVQGSSDSDSEVQRTMLELLNQLDDFEPKQNIK
ncbi:unnamed protein product [Adineta steineri]|uniref:ATPase AAA-type core domain-containing protein n=1 Tax=Adineta steineri TaxID=433720 RepID=A0A815BRM4_9BILA|nr:unnamed protein product [Adineta steineri]CAF1604215.1 unnamed protein product [Adineta steineri]